MYTVTYYKLGNRWYLDAPEYLAQGTSADDLERIGAFHDFLELAAEGSSTVVFHVDTTPFDGADRAELVGSSGGKTGAYYHAQWFRDQEIDLELWLNTVIYIRNQALPQAIYFKRITPP